MAQPSVANYFNTRKRSAVEDKVARARKVLVLDGEDKNEGKERLIGDKAIVFSPSNKLLSKIESASSKKVVIDENSNAKMARKVQRKAPHKKVTAQSSGQRDLQEIFNNMTKATPETESSVTQHEQTEVIANSPDAEVNRRHVTPPSTPTKRVNMLDRVKNVEHEPTFKEIKEKLSRSNRLAELRASIARFKAGERKLEEAEKKTEKIAQSPTLNSFKTLEFEVQVSPQKIFSPEKAYLSPKKDSTARKNLLNLLSPTKNAVALPSIPKKESLTAPVKTSLTLPYKYRSLAEIFRSIDTVCQILFNRKEMITFRKLKPAVEEMLKKNLTEKHLGQIKALFGEAFVFSQAKLKVYGTGTKQEQWELIVNPNVDEDTITSDMLLERRRKLYNILIDKLKEYHAEFLQTLEPPMDISKDKITRWHPEFDIERVPDVEPEKLPQPPDEIKLTSGKEVLEKAKELFNCNTRMEEALARLEKRKAESTQTDEEEKTQQQQPPQSVLKGIPKALLEKVRQKQAAKTLMSLTRSEDKEKEIQTYERLSELARFTRNIFVAEKKGVLLLNTLIDKLENSFRSFLTRSEMQRHLEIIAKEAPGWLVFHEIRNCTYVKVSKNADVSLVLDRLNKIAKKKAEC